MKSGVEVGALLQGRAVFVADKQARTQSRNVLRPKHLLVSYMTVKGLSQRKSLSGVEAKGSAKWERNTLNLACLWPFIVPLSCVCVSNDFDAGGPPPNPTAFAEESAFTVARARVVPFPHEQTHHHGPNPLPHETHGPRAVFQNETPFRCWLVAMQPCVSQCGCTHARAVARPLNPASFKKIFIVK